MIRSWSLQIRHDTIMIPTSLLSPKLVAVWSSYVCPRRFPICQATCGTKITSHIIYRLNTGYILKYSRFLPPCTWLVACSSPWTVDGGCLARKMWAENMMLYVRIVLLTMRWSKRRRSGSLPSQFERLFAAVSPHLPREPSVPCTARCE